MTSKTNTFVRGGVRLSTAAAALGLVALLGGCSDNMAGMPGMGSSASPATSSSATAAFNNADVTFVQMMIPHHEQAVDMSNMLLAKSGVDPDVQALAQQIKAAQGPEITLMTGWLTAWGQPTASGEMGGMHHGGEDGVMTPGQMEALDGADGANGQRLYLEGMIKHHIGAVTMAREELDDGQNRDAVNLARTITDTQTVEITTLENLLAGR